jgi:hypothetical protein
MSDPGEPLIRVCFAHRHEGLGILLVAAMEEFSSLGSGQMEFTSSGCPVSGGQHCGLGLPPPFREAAQRRSRRFPDAVFDFFGGHGGPVEARREFAN